jgi:hypothetical protein
MSAPAKRVIAHQGPQKAPIQSKDAQDLGQMASFVSSDKFLTFNARYGGGCEDLS